MTEPAPVAPAPDVSTAGVSTAGVPTAGVPAAGVADSTGRPPPAVAGTEARIPYLPGLDGLRAVALFAVLCVHAGFSWIDGGFLPLTSFFVLSGFLITALLLCERQRTGRIDLVAFWGRRARRLVPAALIALVLVALYAAFGAEKEIQGLPGDVIASLTWVVNWRFIYDGRDYVDAFSDPSPLQHFWSLAVEEQFYLVLPLLAVVLLWAGRGRRWLFAAVTVALAAGSMVVMQAVHEPGVPPLRAYFGTDTRAAELLVGVLLALVLVGRSGLRRFRGRTATLVEWTGRVALVATIALWVTLREYDNRLFQGGLAAMAVLAALVVAAVTQPGSLVGRVLAVKPLVAIGRISYGIYLFHWPIFLWLDEASTGLSPGPLFALRLGVTIPLAALSWVLVEQPVRNRRLPARISLVGWANASTGLAATLVAVAATLPASGITLRTDGPPPPPVVARVTEPLSGAAAGPAPLSTDPAVPVPVPSVDQSVPEPATTEARAPEETAPPITRAPPAPEPLRVMVVGDSLAQNLATGLSRWLQANGAMAVYDVTRPGCTVTRGGELRFPDGVTFDVPAECASWPQDWSGYLDQFDPEVVVLHTGLGELNDRLIDGWPDFMSPGDPLFDDFALSEYRAAVDVLASRGATVVWTTSPCAVFTDFLGRFSEEEGAARVQYFNRTIVPALGAQRAIVVADLFPVLCPRNRFESTVLGVPDARPDGVHLTDVAAEAVADEWLAPLVLDAGGR